jgi:cell division septal protein FtsQ
MEIKTSNKTREAASARIVPPPDKSRRAKKKAANKLGKGRITGWRLLSGLKILGKIGAIFMIVLFMLSVFLYAYTSEKFNLHTVEVYGCQELDPGHIEDVVRQEFPVNVLRIDLQQLKDRLENETWAKRVEIRRVLPSGIVISVQERKPAVLIEINKELMIADRDGILLGRYNPEKGKLETPLFKGVLGKNAESYRLYQEENSARIKQGLKMLSEIEAQSPEDTKKISEVDLSSRKDLRFMLTDDIAEVHIGNKNYWKRFHSLMENMNKYSELKEQYGGIESIDLRFDDQIIWRPMRINKNNERAKG